VKNGVQVASYSQLIVHFVKTLKTIEGLTNKLDDTSDIQALMWMPPAAATTYSNI